MKVRIVHRLKSEEKNNKYLSSKITDSPQEINDYKYKRNIPCFKMKRTWVEIQRHFGEYQQKTIDNNKKGKHKKD